MHDKLVEYILRKKYNVTDWSQLAKEASNRFSIPREIIEEKRFIRSFINIQDYLLPAIFLTVFLLRSV